MQALNSFLGKLNHPLIIFSVLGLRSGIMGASFGDSLFLISYLGYIGYNKFLENKQKEDLNDKVKAEISELKNTVAAMGLKSSPRNNELGNSKRFF